MVFKNHYGFLNHYGLRKTFVARVQEELGNPPSQRVELLGCPEQDQELDSMIPVGLLHLRII